jgi:hypothetical protein
MIAAMALMEVPAIIVALVLYSLLGSSNTERRAVVWTDVVRDSTLNGPVFLLLGSLAIGALAGSIGWKTMEPMFGVLFTPVLALYLLDMGLLAARQLTAIRKIGPEVACFGIVGPLGHAAAGVVLAKACGLNAGDAFLFVILCASASYIAAPVAIRHALPDANPSIYMTLPLAATTAILRRNRLTAAIDLLWSSM